MDSAGYGLSGFSCPATSSAIADDRNSEIVELSRSTNPLCLSFARVLERGY